uniref:DUF8035 domain-containing protein n=1 Tax=Pyricularia oryzae (strain P131) TaxID=1143193 RepID=L7IPP7_PYRO1
MSAQSNQSNHFSKQSKDYGKATSDETWTKIRRTLISPSVLDKAGIVYQVFPDFVAILGRLSRLEIAEFAHESDELRRRRKCGKIPAYGSYTRPGGPCGTDHWKSNDDKLHLSGKLRSDARGASKETEYEQRYRPRTASKEEERRRDRYKESKEDGYKKNTNSTSRSLDQPAVATTRRDERLPSRPILKRGGTSRVRFDPEVQVHNSPRKAVANKLQEDVHKEREADNERRDRCCCRGRARPSMEQHSPKNSHRLEKADGKHISRGHGIEVLVRNWATDYDVHILLKTKDPFGCHARTSPPALHTSLMPNLPGFGHAYSWDVIWRTQVPCFRAGGMSQCEP